MGDDAVRPFDAATGGAIDTTPAGPESTGPEAAAPIDDDPAHAAESGKTDGEEQPHPVGYSTAEADSALASGGTQVVQDAAAPTPAQLRVDFGAHLEANYRRLVAQLYAITLDPAEAHSVVQDAYSRAW